MKKLVLMSALIVFACANAYAGPATIYEASVFSNYNYNADSGTGYFMMLAGVTVDTTAYDVYIQGMPSPAPSDLQLPLNLDYALMGNIYSDYFATWQGYPDPEDSSWEGTYTFYVNDDGTSGFSGGDTTYPWTIPVNGISEMALVTDVNITGGNHPTISWDTVSAANYYRVRLYHPDSGELLWQSNLLAEAQGTAQSFQYTEDLFEQHGLLDVAIEANDGAGAEQDWLNRSRYVVAYNAVPIPGAVWLLGSGFIGLVGLRKKFKK